MLLALLLLPQLRTPAARSASTDSTYENAALRTLVQSAAAFNATIPPALRAYRAQLESEVAVVLRSAVEKESALQIEQIESTLQWVRPNHLEQHVIGYRARAVTANLSALTYFRRPWIVPWLYGNRLRVLLSHDKEGDGSEHGATLAVHPFSEDRERYYRFSGGDTVEVLGADGRSIPIVRVEVEPTTSQDGALLRFRGEIDVDASRFQIVRMRGEFVQTTSRASIGSRVRHLALQSVAYAELENGEFLGAYWLPTYQRIEAQGRSPLAAELRPVFRVVTRFRHHEIDESSGVTTASPAEQTFATDTTEARLTMASRDSVSRFTHWSREIGDETVAARASDFDDVAPDAWRTRGPARLDWHAEHFSDVVRFNRVEGLFSGASATLRLRDRAPGVALGAYGGLAWSERTWRGAVVARRLHGPWLWNVSAERQLANTNDFRPTLDFESSLMAALVTADDYDYLDRRRAGLQLTRAIGGWSGASLRFESGYVADRSVSAHVQFGLIHPDSAFRPNRAIDAGRAWRNALSLSVHPNVSGEMLEPGLGGGISYERGDGDLAWQRLEGRLIGRHSWRALTYAARLDVAAAFGAPVPRQQLVEFGENEGLPGYLYKEFGGDRAALLRGSVAYQLPLLRAPVHAWRGLVLPSLSPSIAIGLQSGWAQASTSTLQQFATFGVRRDSLTGLALLDHRSGLPVLATRPTDGVRSTLGVSLRFFGGAVGIGMARAIDRRQPWRLTIGVGQGL